MSKENEAQPKQELTRQDIENNEKHKHLEALFNAIRERRMGKAIDPETYEKLPEISNIGEYKIKYEVDGKVYEKTLKVQPIDSKIERHDAPIPLGKVIENSPKVNSPNAPNRPNTKGRIPEM